jgi:tetratricopeptide (TPR) repeat protein
MRNSEKLYNDGQYEAALEWCKKEIDRNPTNADAYSNAGRICLLLGQLKEAEEYFEKAIKLDEQNGEHYFDLGNIFFGQERYDDALVNYARAEQLGCSDETKQKLFYMVGLLNQAEMNNTVNQEKKMKQAQAALINFNKSNSISTVNPNRYEILLSSIQIYVESGDFKKAENSAMQLKLLAPNEFGAYQLLFQILLQQQLTDRAESVLEEAKKFCQDATNNVEEIAFDYALLYCFMAEQNPELQKTYYSKAIKAINGLVISKDTSLIIKCNAEMTMAEIYLKMDYIEQSMTCSLWVANLNVAEDEEYAIFFDKAYYILIEGYLLKQEFEKATYYSLKLKKSDNIFYRHHAYYSEAYAEMKKKDAPKKVVDDLYDRAIAYFANAMVVNQSDFLAVIYRTKAYADMGKYDKADEMRKKLPVEAQQSLVEYINSKRGGGTP